MGAVYPGSVRGFNSKIDLVDTVFALHINDLQDEVTAVQNVLGTNPQGAATGPATVSKRMTDLEAGKSATTHTHPTLLDAVAHDVAGRHTFGAALGTPPTPTAITIGSAGAIGTAVNPAHGDHDHPFPSAGSLANTVIPAGSIMMYGGTTAPTGWALCDGSSQLRGTTSADPYYNLYQVIGVGYGNADGTHFNLPDLRSKFPMGRATAAAAIVTAGARDAVIVSHAHPGSSVSNGNADHNHYVEHAHAVNAGGGAHSHSIYPGWAWNADIIKVSVGGPQNAPRAVAFNNANGTEFMDYGHPEWINDHTHGNTAGMTTRSTSDGASGAANHGHGLTVATQGVSATDANLPPYQTVNFIIKL